AESMVALAIGFVSAALLAFPAGLATAIGSSRVKSEGPGAGIGGPLALFVLIAFPGGLLTLVWTIVNQVSQLNPSAMMARQVYISVAGSVFLLILLSAMVLI